MTNSRKTTFAVVIAAAVIAVATVSFTARPAATQPSEDFGLRHPGGMPGALASVVVNYAGSELASNDPDFAIRPAGVDTSDYFLRHPELIRASVDTSDYALRHPELSRK